MKSEADTAVVDTKLAGGQCLRVWRQHFEVSPTLISDRTEYRTPPEKAKKEIQSTLVGKVSKKMFR